MEDEFRGTITAKEDFDVEFAAKRFHKAFKGIGSDEKMIIKMLVQHDSLQRQEIEEKYKEMYGKDLIDDLKDELGGHFEEAAVALMTSPYDLLCGSLHDALKGMGTDEKTIIDILCCRDPDEIINLSSHYMYIYDEELDEVVNSELSGDFKRLIRGLIAGGRDMEDNVDPANARKDAQELYDAGIGSNADTDEAEFIRILNTRSYAQLKEIFDAYDSIADETIEASIEKEFSGDIKTGLLAIVQRVRDPLGFYAERLNGAMAGAGTDDKALIRILVSRSQIDLADIRSRYKELYSSDLVEDIKADCSGDYCKLLVALAGGESQ
ncbi:annexin-B12-like [Penaeus japonicus]|uniref:annexin-B12-like n=1 Tax=Penaeus japonicus TaxID=27405 RepID=UPI001C714B73|nr:annexin-B12-like [Penaeus japonicus]